MIIRPYDPAHLEGVVRLSLRAGFGLFPVARYFKKLQAGS
jgi:hypothetical protein